MNDRHGESQALLNDALARLNVVRGPDGRGEYLCWCCFHADGSGPGSKHKPNLNVSERGFICRACGEKGSLGKLAAHLGVETQEAPLPDRTYDYRTAEGEVLFQVVRRAGKQFLQRRPDGKEGWVWNLKGVEKVVHRLPEMLAEPEAVVFVTEGEKDAEHLASLGMVATTNAGGAGKWQRAYSDSLPGRDVVSLPDNDQPGRRHAEQVANLLTETARSVKVLALPGLPPKGDVPDWLSSGHTPDELQSLAEACPVWQRETMADVDSAPEDEGGRQSQATQLIELATSAGIRLFHDERGEAYAYFTSINTQRVMAVGSKSFMRWLSHLAWARLGRSVGSDALHAAIHTLAGMACFDGEQYTLNVRCPGTDETVRLDIDGRRAIKVTHDGWHVVEVPPILFRSFPHQDPMPVPVAGGNPRRVLDFVNLREESDRLLLLCFLVVALVPDIALAALVVHGVQGSGKTYLLNFVRSLLDPSSVAVRGVVSGLDESALSAWQNRLLFFDNLGTVPLWLSDALCRAISGEGWQKRSLYSDEDTTVLRYRRVIGLSGINLVAQRPDLLDRSVILALEPFPPGQRLSERELWERFDAERPAIIGGLLDTLAKALRVEPTLPSLPLPRMADFCRWGIAAAVAMGHAPEDFLNAYERNVAAQNSAAIDASPVAQAVLALMGETSCWEGTPTCLLEELRATADRSQIAIPTSAWPQNASWLSRRLREVHTNLLAIGVEVDENRSSDQRLIRLRKACEDAVISDACCAPAAGAQQVLDTGEGDSATKPDRLSQAE